MNVPSLDLAAAEQARARQGVLTKPRGSLGQLEEIAVRMAAIQGDPRPQSRPATALIFAADHPVAAHGVSAYPAEVTRAMLTNFAHGGAAASVLARLHRVPLEVIDVGVQGEALAERTPAREGARVRRDPVADDRAGDLLETDAVPEVERAIAAGRAAVMALSGAVRVLILGEMGIGNSTAAAALAGALLGCRAHEITGPGTGVVGDALTRKQEIVEAALIRARGRTPLEILRAVSGKELAALVGAMQAGVSRRMTILVDGFIVSAAALATERLCPGSSAFMLFAHRSAEPGHARVLEALHARPLLSLDMRLGEASGALAALPLVDAACALHDQMATFAEAAVPERSP